MAEQDIIRLFFLEVDGEKVASTLCFDWEGSRLLYNSGFNRDFSEYSVGLLLKVICLRDAIDQGKEYFDFLRGPERYKYQLGCNDREIYEIKIAGQ
jgi:CelD/BcsL family acetyltransferase involved in cellulose biosynthesis